MISLTPAQENAVYARNRNLIVSAAAGSGKTAVLVQRVIKMITAPDTPVDVDRLLIVTFTNPAAAEMKSRISSALADMLVKQPNNANILRQMSLLQNASISTIDSFCLNLAKENAFKLGISQEFSILDEARAQIIADTAINNVLDRLFEERDSSFISLVEMLSPPKDDKSLISTIKNLHNYIYAQPFPLKWLEDMTEFYNPANELTDSEWYNYLKEYVSDGIACAKDLLEACYAFLVEDDAYDKYTETLDEDKALLASLENALNQGWDDALSAFKKAKFITQKYVRGYTPSYKEEVAARRSLYKDIIVSLADVFCATQQEFKADNEILYPILKTLCKVVSEFDSEYFALKEEESAFTFSDIEHFALNLLVDFDCNGKLVKSALAKDLESSYYEILVDEYQDTNEAQDLLFELLSNGKNRFMVGDVKQSIYRFRLAMPFLFNQKKEAYPLYNKNDNSDSSKIILDKNFRSRQGICDLTNFLFSAFMSAKTGELDYTEEEYLNYQADYPESSQPSAEIKILTNVKGADTDKNEAAYIASVIQNKIMNKEQISVNGALRDVRYSDFVILLRSVKNHIGAYSEALTERGIPVVCDNSSNLFDNNEIKMLISFLKVIDNPRQEVPLLAVMMSPLYGFTPDELAEIRLENENANSFYSCIILSQSEKVKSFLKELELLRKVVVTMSVASFIRYICEYKSLYAFANALGNGEQRCRNINKLIELAAYFDSTQSVGLTAFMRLIDKLENGDKTVESAAVNSAGENAVTIMSVHHSKGLEFPIVILAGTQRKYNYDDLKSRLLLNHKFGLGVKLHNEELLYQTETIPYTALKHLNKTASMSENLRVLYVAVTRAKEQFISFISLDNLEKRINTLAPRIADGTINPFLCRNISCDGDLLLLAALIHKDGAELRKLCEINVNVSNSDFDMPIEIIDSVEDIEKTEVIVAAAPSQAVIDEIKNRLSFNCDRYELAAIPAKRNASDLDESIKSAEFFATSKPAFLSSKGLSPSERGTAMHAFMQFCNYNSANSDLEAEIERLTDEGFITKEQAASLNREALSAFFKSELAKRMFCSDAIYKEIKVTTFVSSGSAPADEDDRVLIQGIADCVFEEDGELVLVDYKTDRVANEDELLNMYRNQIAFYKEAVAKVLQKPVKEALLYSFYLSKPCAYN